MTGVSRKWISLLLAVSLVAGLFAATAAANTAQNELNTIISNVHARLTAGETSIVAGAASAAAQLSDANIIDPVWDAAWGVDKQEYFALVVDAIALPYKAGGNAAVLDTHRAVIEQLVDAAGLNGLDEVSWSDIAAFVTAMEQELARLLVQGDTIADLLGSLLTGSGFTDALDAVIHQAVHNVMGKSSLAVSRLYAGLGISGAQVVDARNAILDEIDADRQATQALALGYIRTKSTLASQPVRSNSLAPQLRVLNVLVPASVIDWTIDGSNRLSYNAASKHFVVTGSGSATVTAHENVTGDSHMLYSGTFAFTYTSTSTSPEGGEEPSAQPKDDDSEPSEQTPGEVGGQPREAEKEAAKAVKSAGKLEVSATVEGGKAVAALNAADVLTKAAEAKTKADEVNGQLSEQGGRSVRAELTIDLGVIEGADSAVVALAPGLIDDLSSAGIEVVSVSFNGAELSASVSDLANGTTISISQRSAAEEPALDGTTAASDVYDFEVIADNGQPVAQFADPLTLSLEINGDVSDVDTELLTLARLSDDKLKYYVGVYNEETNSVAGLRDGLSSYVVVENRVTFTDLEPVKSWAPRFIEIAAAKGVIVGDGQGSFRPTDHVTRAEFTKMLVSAFSLSNATTTGSFTDVQAGNWFAPYVAVAVSKGIVADGSLFNPNRPITRAEMAAIVGRALRSELGMSTVANVEATLAAFGDADRLAAGLRGDAAVTVAQGIMVGADGKFNPNGLTTRAEAAVVIKKLIDLL